LYVAQASRTDEVLPDRFVVSSDPPPFVEPQIVSLDGTTKEKSVQVQAVATVVVRGAVRWPGVQPAVGCDVTAWFMGPEGFRAGVKLASSVTDQEGRYSFQLPQTRQEVDVSAVGLNDAKRVFFIARPADSAPAARKNHQHMTFHGLQNDIEGADWVLERFKFPGSPAPEAEAKQAQTPGEAELERLGAQYARLEEKYLQALAKATTDEERDTVYRTLDPRNLLADEFLQLEQRHRGTLAGFSALHRLEGLARSVGSPEIPVSLARKKLVDILLDDYLDHEDLDLCLSGFDAGAPVEKSAILLKRATESRRRHVRAAALYYQAIHLHALAEWAEQMDRTLSRLSKDPQKNAQKIESIKTHRATLGPIDVEASRRMAIELSQRVQNEYGDAQEPPRIFDCRSYQIQHVSASEISDRRPSYGEMATGLLFEIKRLAVGQPVPDITGTDVAGRPFRLSDHRGKVVAVIFAMNLGTEELAENQKICDEFGDRAFVLVGISSYPQKEAVADAVRKSQIKWPMLWEGSRGPIATQWHIQGWPTTYIIDGRGIIRSKSHDLRSAMNLVSDFIQEAAQR
jgi:peroxiredoxin